MVIQKEGLNVFLKGSWILKLFLHNSLYWSGFNEHSDGIELGNLEPLDGVPTDV